MVSIWQVITVRTRVSENAQLIKFLANLKDFSGGQVKFFDAIICNFGSENPTGGFEVTFLLSY